MWYLFLLYKKKTKKKETKYFCVGRKHLREKKAKGKNTRAMKKIKTTHRNYYLNHQMKHPTVVDKGTLTFSPVS